MLWLRLEILCELDTNSPECTSSDVEKAYSTLDLYLLYALQLCSINMQIAKLRTILKKLIFRQALKHVSVF